MKLSAIFRENVYVVHREQRQALAVLRIGSAPTAMGPGSMDWRQRPDPA